jgi:hypothetical protein
MLGRVAARQKVSLWIFSSLGLTIFRLEASKEFSSGNGLPGQRRAATQHDKDHWALQRADLEHCPDFALHVL